jgi:hypothetical protein
MRSVAYMPGLSVRSPFEDVAARRRAQRERLPHGAAPLDGVDLALRDVPVGEPAPRGRDEVRGAAARLVARLPNVALQPAREEELLLRLHEHRRVDREQRLAGDHGLAGGVHHQALHPPVDLGRDGLHARLVEGDLADGADLLRERAYLRGRVRDADALRLGRRERHRLPGCRRRGAAVDVASRRRRGAALAARREVDDAEGQTEHPRVCRGAERARATATSSEATG